VANVVPPVGEYVIAVPSGTYNADFVFTAHKEGFRPATVTLRVGTPSPSITIPLPTVVALTVMVAALIALVWYRRTIRHDESQGKSVVSIVMPTKIAQE